MGLRVVNKRELRVFGRRCRVAGVSGDETTMRKRLACISSHSSTDGSTNRIARYVLPYSDDYDRDPMRYTLV